MSTNQNPFFGRTLQGIRQQWRLAAQMPNCPIRDHLYWQAVAAVKASGYIGGARRAIESAAKW